MISAQAVFSEGTFIRRQNIYLVNFLIYSLHLVSLHPLCGNTESKLLIFYFQVVVDTLQKTVDAGQLKRSKAQTDSAGQFRCSVEDQQRDERFESFS